MRHALSQSCAVRTLAPLALAMLLLAPALGAQLAPGRWVHPFQSDGRKGEDPSGARHLSGTVVDASGHPVPGAIVYLENRHNLAIFTYIAGNDGSYRFNNLSPDVDYEVHAEAGGRKSSVKTLSSFDSHKRAQINLKLNK